MSRFDNIPPQLVDMPHVTNVARAATTRVTATGPDQQQDLVYADFTGWSMAASNPLAAVSWAPAQRRYFGEDLLVYELPPDLNYPNGHTFKFRWCSINGVNLSVGATLYSVEFTDPIAAAGGSVRSASMGFGYPTAARLTQNTVLGRYTQHYTLGGMWRTATVVGLMDWNGATFADNVALPPYRILETVHGQPAAVPASRFSYATTANSAAFGAYSYAGTNGVEHFLFDTDSKGCATNIQRALTTGYSGREVRRIVKLDATYFLPMDEAAYAVRQQFSPVGVPDNVATSQPTTGISDMFAADCAFKNKAVVYFYLGSGYQQMTVQDWSSTQRTTEYTNVSDATSQLTIMLVRLNDTQCLKIRHDGGSNVYARVMTYAGVGAPPTEGTEQLIGTVTGGWGSFTSSADNDHLARSVGFTMPGNRVFVYLRTLTGGFYTILKGAA